LNFVQKQIFDHIIYSNFCQTTTTKQEIFYEIAWACKRKELSLLLLLELKREKREEEEQKRIRERFQQCLLGNGSR
jgi:hypothetical protein